MPVIDTLAKRKRIFLLSGIGLCILAIIFTVNPAVGPNVFARGLSYIVVPMQTGVSSSVGWVRGHFTAISQNQQLLQTNQTLQEQIAILQIENHRLQRADDENYRLSTLLNMSQRYAQLPKMGARVIGRNPNDALSRFFIDRGTADDVERNMAVLDGEGLLGVVRQVHPTHSQFLTVIDPDFSAAVMSARTEDIGTVRGDLHLKQEGLMRMDHISATAQIIPGDEIITSPHSSIFPPGILVGRVRSIYSNPDGLTRHAIITPVIDLENIEIVLVVSEIFGDRNITHDGHLFVHED